MTAASTRSVPIDPSGDCRCARAFTADDTESAACRCSASTGTRSTSAQAVCSPRAAAAVAASEAGVPGRRTKRPSHRWAPKQTAGQIHDRPAATVGQFGEPLQGEAHPGNRCRLRPGEPPTHLGRPAAPVRQHTRHERWPRLLVRETGDAGRAEHDGDLRASDFVFLFCSVSTLGSCSEKSMPGPRNIPLLANSNSRLRIRQQETAEEMPR